MAITFTFCHMDSCLEAARFTHLQQVKKQLVLFLFGSFLIISCQKGSSFISNFKQIGYKKISVITRRLKRPRRQGSQEERKTQKSEHPPHKDLVIWSKNAKNKTSGWQQPRPPRPQKAQQPLLRMSQPLSRLFTSWVQHLFWHRIVEKKKLQGMFLTSPTEGDNNNAAKRSRTLAERIWPSSKVEILRISAWFNILGGVSKRAGHLERLKRQLTPRKEGKNYYF